MVGKGLALACMFLVAFLSGCTGPAPKEGAGGDAQAGSAAPVDPVTALGGQEAKAAEPRADASAGSGKTDAGGNASVATAPDPRLGTFQVVPQLAPGDVAPWYLAALAIPDGEAGLAGFRWTVPPGSVKQHKDFESFRYVSLEVAFLVPEGERVDAYSVSWFVLDGETPRLHRVLLGVPIDYTSKLTPALQDSEMQEVSLRPTFVSFSDGYVEDGTTLGIVVSAEGDARAFGVAWRILDEPAYFSDDEPAEDAAEFLEDAMDVGAGLALAPRGTGAGFQACLYLDLNFDALLGLELKTGPIVVTDGLATEALRPAASVRELTVASSYENPRPDGWGYAVALYLTDVGLARWSVRGDVHGTSVDESGIAAGVHAVSLWGFASAYGGEAPSSSVVAEFEIESVDTLELLQVLSIDYGTAVSVLLGSKPPAKEPAEYDPDQAGAALQGADLVVRQPDGSGIVLLGVGDHVA